MINSSFDLLTFIEELVNNAAELELCRANPRQYLIDKGALYETGDEGVSFQLSTVMKSIPDEPSAE